MAHCGQHILEMQLFHELKQRFPNIPDRIISQCIKQTRGERSECRCLLEAENWFGSGRMSSGRGGGGQASRDLVDHFSQLVLQHVPAPPIQPSQTSPSAILRELIALQLAQKKRLEVELAKEKERLNKLRESVKSMQKDMIIKRNTKGQQLKIEIIRLRNECHQLASDVDLLVSDVCPGPVPLGETNEDFYQNIYPGPIFKKKHKQKPSRHKGSGSKKNEDHWCCHLCTFKNHPLLNKCEECDMPRFSPVNFHEYFKVTCTF